MQRQDRGESEEEFFATHPFSCERFVDLKAVNSRNYRVRNLIEYFQDAGEVEEIITNHVKGGVGRRIRRTYVLAAFLLLLIVGGFVYIGLKCPTIRTSDSDHAVLYCAIIMVAEGIMLLALLLIHQKLRALGIVDKGGDRRFDPRVFNFAFSFYKQLHEHQYGTRFKRLDRYPKHE